MATRVENIRTNIYINDKTAGKNLRQLTNESRKLRNEIALLRPGTQQFIEKSKELRSVNARIRSIRNELNGVNNSWSKAAQGFNKYAAMVTAAAAALTGFAISALNVIKRNAELSDSMADVMKTTGLTQKEVKELYSEFGKMNTRTSRAELLGLAEEAGRLGIEGKKNILEFVKVANQLKVALGDDLGGDEAIREVGKLTEQFRVAEREGTDFETAMLKVGSALNEIAASGSAQASWQVDFMKRMAPTADSAGILAGNILGIGAALDEAGQSAETSGTALSKFVMDMFTDTATYAELAGMEMGDFATLLETDANGALLKVLEGLKGNNEGFSILSKRLDGLGLDGARAIGVITSMANNLDKVREKQALANQAMADGTSLTNEYNIKNENLAAGWERLQRAIAGAFINSQFTDALKDIVFWLNKLIEVPVSEVMEEERLAMMGLRIELMNTNLPAERRVQIIRQLKEQYPGYLTNIDEEKVTNQELLPILDEINTHLIKRIALQRANEKLQEKQQGYAEAVAKEAEYRIKIGQEVARLAEEHNLTLKDGIDIIAQGKTVFAQLGTDAGYLGRLIYNGFEENHKVVAAFNNSMQDALAEVKNINEEIDAMLGIDKLDTPAPGGTKDSGKPQAGDFKEEDGWLWRYDGEKWVKHLNLGSTETENKAADARKRLLEVMRQIEISFINDEYSRELAQIDERYARLTEQANGELELIKQLEEYKFQEKMKLVEKHLMDEQAFIEAFEEDLFSEDLVDDGVSTFVNANKQMTDANQQLVEARVDGLNRLLQGTQSFANRSSGLFKAMFVAEKATAVGQLIIELQKQIALINTKYAAIPGGPLLAAGEITAAKVRTGLSIATIAAQGVGQLSFDKGGYTGFGYGRPDASGFKPAGIVHEGEYVIPKWMMQTDYVANIAGMLENIRTSQQGFAQGGPTSTVVEKYNTTNTTVIDQAEVVALLRQISEGLKRPAIAVMTDKTVRDIDERLTRNSTITNRSKLN